MERKKFIGRSTRSLHCSLGCEKDGNRILKETEPRLDLNKESKRLKLGSFQEDITLRSRDRPKLGLFGS